MDKLDRAAAADWADKAQNFIKMLKHIGVSDNPAELIAHAKEQIKHEFSDEFFHGVATGMVAIMGLLYLSNGDAQMFEMAALPVVGSACEQVLESKEC